MAKKTEKKPGSMTDDPNQDEVDISDLQLNDDVNPDEDDDDNQSDSPDQNSGESSDEQTIDIKQLQGRRIGRILVKLGKVTREQVQEGLQMQESRRLPIGQILVELGYVTDEDINQALAAQAGMETLDLESRDFPEEIIHLSGRKAQAFMPGGVN